MWWFKIKSWHAVKLTRSIEPRSLCGRRGTASSETSDELPSGRSCETCLRIYARQADASGG